MRGTLKQRSKGSWTLTFDTGLDTTGKRRRQTVTIRGTKRQAEARLAELVHKVGSGEYSNPSKVTLGGFVEQWLRDHAWPNLSPETAQVYEIIANAHIIPALGSIPLQKLTPERLQAFYADKLARGRRDGSGGLSPRTVRHHHRLLHVTLENAVKWRLISRNPADAVDPPRFNRKEMQAFDQDGLNEFLETIRETEYYPLFYTLLFTGLRRSEALALRWRDVDLVLGYISVNRTLHQLNDKSFVFRQPKTEKSRRTVALPPSLSIVLRQHQESQQKQRALLATAVSDDDLIFAQLDGSPLLPHSITNAWRRLVKQAGFQGVRLHDARHTHATLMLKQGVNAKIISERLGHSSVVITLDTYSHVLPGLQEAAARGFDAGLRRTNQDVMSSSG